MNDRQRYWYYRGVKDATSGKGILCFDNADRMEESDRLEAEKYYNLGFNEVL